MIDPYLEKYRQKVSDVKSTKLKIRTLIQDAQSEVNQLCNNLQSLEKECNSMRKIITKMIEEGIDTVEARLITNESDKQRTLWDSNYTPGGYDGVISTDLSNIISPELYASYPTILDDIKIFGTTNGFPYIGMIKS